MWLGVNLRKHEHLKMFGTGKKGVIGEKEKNQNSEKDENSINEGVVMTAICLTNTQHQTIRNLEKCFTILFLNFLSISLCIVKTFEGLRAFVYVGYVHWELKVECENIFKYLLIKYLK